MFQKQINEISSSRALPWYGFALSLSHVLTFFFVYHFPQILSRVQNPICWDWFKNCQIVRFSSEWPWQVLLHLYLGIAVIALCAFYFKKVRLGFFALFICMLLKYAGGLLDYSFMGNYHYMHFLAQIAFLFLPQKKKIIPLLVGFFYLAAGSLKLNAEWITGAALIKPFPIGGPNLLMAACIGVIFLELFIVLGLFAKNNIARWLSLFCFIAFHAISYFWVGYFYPLIMFCLLSIFVLLWINRETPENWSDLKKINVLFLALITVLQIIPLFGKDPSLYTERRIWSLNMYDARAACLNSIILKYADHQTDYTYDGKNHGVRVQCDPLLYRSQAINLCRQERTDPLFEDLDLILLAKRQTGTNFEPILIQKNFCKSEGLRP